MLRQSSPIQRKTPMKAKPNAVRRCKTCKAKHTSTDPRVEWCSEDCAVTLALKRLERHKAKEAAKRKKLEREATKERKEAATPIRTLLRQTEEAVNEYVRERDRFLGCISCFKPSHWDGLWTASHFKSVGSNSTLRYHLWNIHKGCSECNLFKSGNLVEYEKRLRLKIGNEKVEWLKCQSGLKKYTPEYLIRLKKIMRKKTRRLEKRRGK